MASSHFSQTADGGSHASEKAPRWALWFLLFPVMLGICVALAAWDRSRIDQLEEVIFTRTVPAYFSVGSVSDPSQPVAHAYERPLYLLNPIPVVLQPGEVYPLALEDEADPSKVVAVQIPRNEQRRLREDGTLRYYLPVAPGEFVELTNLPPTAL